ncbi:MAG: RHS repeat-associated core domain-containing protein [Alphaproteobacteria bacterium]|nr:RHS repeat-associated core domain-containing protein [Alphaproteobacteria bacterium]
MLDCVQQDKNHFWGVTLTLPYSSFSHFFPEKTINRNESFTLVFPDNSPRFRLFTSTGKDPRKGWRTPLKNIKYSEQRDEETGYSYFGARYYDPEISGLFLSVDPLADKYVSISPYAYCAWNPVRLVDPTGSDTINYDLSTGNRIYFKPEINGKHCVNFFWVTIMWVLVVTWTASFHQIMQIGMKTEWLDIQIT